MPQGDKVLSHAYAVVLLWPNAALRGKKLAFYQRCYCQQCVVPYAIQSCVFILYIQTTIAIPYMQ